MECEDCNKETAEFIVFDNSKKKFFALCHSCICDNIDFILDNTLIERFKEV